MAGKELAVHRVSKNIIIEDANIQFLNFAGKEGMYNTEGDRNFCIILDPQMAEDMRQDGWNIKLLKARDEGDEPRPYIQVAVKFKGRPPSIHIVTSRGKTTLTEDEVEIIDWLDIKQADLIINPYHWNVNGNSGIKAYLKSLYIVIDESALDLKYAEVPELDSSSAPLQIEPPKDSKPGDEDIIEAEAEWVDER